MDFQPCVVVLVWFFTVKIGDAGKLFCCRQFFRFGGSTITIQYKYFICILLHLWAFQAVKSECLVKSHKISYID